MKKQKNLGSFPSASVFDFRSFLSKFILLEQVVFTNTLFLPNMKLSEDFNCYLSYIRDKQDIVLTVLGFTEKVPIISNRFFDILDFERSQG